VRQNSSLHENYRDAEPTEAGSDRAFGCTVGSILMVIGATKAFVAGTVAPIACLLLAAGALLLLLGSAAPSHLSMLNNLWSKIGTLIAKWLIPSYWPYYSSWWLPRWPLRCGYWAKGHRASRLIGPQPLVGSSAGRPGARRRI
jgi:hypothetical protein